MGFLMHKLHPVAQKPPLRSGFVCKWFCKEATCRARGEAGKEMHQKRRRHTGPTQAWPGLTGKTALEGDCGWHGPARGAGLSHPCPPQPTTMRTLGVGDLQARPVACAGVQNGSLPVA